MSVVADVSIGTPMNWDLVDMGCMSDATKREIKALLGAMRTKG